MDKAKINGIPFVKFDLVPSKDLYLIQKDTEKLNKTIKYNRVDILKNPDQPLANLVYSDSQGNEVASFDISTKRPLSKMHFLEKCLVSGCAIVGIFTKYITNNADGPQYTF